MIASHDDNCQPKRQKAWRPATIFLLWWVASLAVSPVTAEETVRLEGATVSLVDAPVMAAALLGDRLSLGQHQHLAFLSIELDEGWKTYWRLPGRFGLAPQLDWAGSTNLADAQVLFPAPVLFEEADGRSIGYSSPVHWPIIVTSQDADEPVLARLDFDFGLCEVLCLPQQVRLETRLDSGQASDRGPTLSELVPLASRLPGVLEEDAISVTVSQGEVTVQAEEALSPASLVVVQDGNERHTLLQVGQSAKSWQGPWPWDAPPTAVHIIEPARSVHTITLAR